jgi:spoIIIJ-associated protein
VDERDRDAQLEGALLLGSEDQDDDRLDDAEARPPRDDDGYDDDFDEEKADDAKDVLRGILDRMGLDADVKIREDDERIVLDVTGSDAGRAIGKKGQTLDALQFLVNKVVNRFPEGRRHVVVDSGDYRERHDRSLLSMARREAKRAVEQGRTVTLQPMPARDRRLIHLSLAKMTGVTTKSNGEGIGRRIQIIPSKASGGGERRRRRR